MLICNDLTATSWGRILFRDLGLCLLPGSLLVVTGASPKAAEALLDTLAGLKKPRRGEARFEGQPVLGNTEYKGLVLRIPAAEPLPPNVTVAETVQRFSGGQETGMLAQAALRYFMLDDFAGYPCAALSASQVRRVTFTRLLTQPRPIWFISHAREALDEETRTLLYGLIMQRCDQGGTVVVTADNADFIKPCAHLALEDFMP